MPNERTEATDSVLMRLAEETASVPALFWHEMRNILLLAERRGRLPAEGATPGLGRLRRLPIETAEDPGDAAVLMLAATRRLTAYDATYLALAMHTSLPMATCDGALAEAAFAEGIMVFCG